MAESKKCPVCDGDGELYVGSSVPDDEGYAECLCCGGSGELPTPEQIADIRAKLQEAQGDAYVDYHLLKDAEKKIAVLEKQNEVLRKTNINMADTVTNLYAEIDKREKQVAELEAIVNPPIECGDASGGEFGYPAAARTIALWLDDYCDRSLPYPQMVADAVRQVVNRVAELEAEIKLGMKVKISPSCKYYEPQYDQEAVYMVTYLYVDSGGLNIGINEEGNTWSCDTDGYRVEDLIVTGERQPLPQQPKAIAESAEGE